MSANLVATCGGGELALTLVSLVCCAQTKAGRARYKEFDFGCGGVVCAASRACPEKCVRSIGFLRFHRGGGGQGVGAIETLSVV